MVNTEQSAMMEDGRVFKKKPRPDKRCPPPGSLFRSPPALLNEAKQLCNFATCILDLSFHLNKQMK